MVKGSLLTEGHSPDSTARSMYLVKKYGHGSKDLRAGEISEQFITLSCRKREQRMLKQMTDYFAALENFRKAA